MLNLVPATLLALLLPGLPSAAPAGLLDVAWAFRDCDAALAARVPATEGEAGAIGRRLDAAAGAWFAGDLDLATRRLARLALDWSAPGLPAIPGLEGLRAATRPVDPVVGDAIALRVQRDAADAAAPVEIVATGWGVARRVTLDAGATRAIVALPPPPAGDHELKLEAADRPFRRLRVSVFAEPPSEIVRGATARLDAAPASVAESVALCRTRVARLRRLDPMARVATPRAAFARATAAEAAELAEGRDPYVGRPADLWIDLPAGGATIPCRLLLPAAVAGADPLPLVVALHGAGGNEHLFPETYGAGHLARRAERDGFVLLSPVTYAMLAAPDALPELVDRVARLAAIDRSRVLLIGHSLGGVAAMSQGARHASRVAGVAALAGAAPLRRVDSPPMRLWATRDDSIVPFVGLEGIARQAQAAGAPLEFTVLDAGGHLLMVTLVLDEALDWLLARPPRVLDQGQGPQSASSATTSPKPTPPSPSRSAGQSFVQPQEARRATRSPKPTAPSSSRSPMHVGGAGVS